MSILRGTDMGSWVIQVQVLVVFLLAAGCEGTTFQQLNNEDNVQIIWGMGNEIPDAVESSIYQDAPVRMITSWFNGPDDLDWMEYYRARNTMAELYGKGYAQELVVWLHEHPEYAISQQFLDDLETLIDIFKGNGPEYGPLYVVLFTEFETYSDDPKYYQRLKEAFLEAKEVIQRVYSNSYVAMGFGGYGWSGIEERQLKDWELEVLQAGDFAAVQAHHHITNVDLMIPQIRNSVKQLGSYGKPVMLSHFRIWKYKGEAGPSGSQVFNAFIDEMFTDESLKVLAGDGLFSWNFFNDTYIHKKEDAYRKLQHVITTYGSEETDLSFYRQP